MCRKLLTSYVLRLLVEALKSCILSERPCPVFCYLLGIIRNTFQLFPSFVQAIAGITTEIVTAYFKIYNI